MKITNVPWRFLAVAAMVVGIGLRLAALERWCLWTDELASLRRATELPLREHLVEMRGNHPLYEVLVLRPWGLLGQSDAWIRLPSVLAGSLTLFVTFFLGRACSRRTAVLATWLLALAPLHVMFSRLARPYSLAALWAVLASLALLAYVRHHHPRALVAYAVLAALLVLTNLFALSLLVAHAIFLLWFYRRRLRALMPWVAAGVATTALLAPWLVINAMSAVTWSQDTPYAGQQMGTVVKLLYLPFTFALGETVHPLDLWVVVPALAGFTACFVTGVLQARRHAAALFFLLQVVVVLAAAMVFRAAAPKHTLIALPAFAVVAALGLERLRLWALTALVCAASAISLTNYFAGRDFHDADMVTPWRQITKCVQEAERPGEIVFVGYHGDPDVWRMFNRYYRPEGKNETRWLRLREPSEWQTILADELRVCRRFWLLLHAVDPRREVEIWLEERKCLVVPQPFQIEEHTLRGLREGLAHARKYRSPLYILYLVEAPATPTASDTVKGDAVAEEAAKVARAPTLDRALTTAFHSSTNRSVSLINTAHTPSDK